jgi:hypothetical protein
VLVHKIRHVAWRGYQAQLEEQCSIVNPMKLLSTLSPVHTKKDADLWFRLDEPGVADSLVKIKLLVLGLQHKSRWRIAMGCAHALGHAESHFALIEQGLVSAIERHSESSVRCASLQSLNKLKRNLPEKWLWKRLEMEPESMEVREFLLALQRVKRTESAEKAHQILARVAQKRSVGLPLRPGGWTTPRSHGCLCEYKAGLEDPYGLLELLLPLASDQKVLQAVSKLPGAGRLAIPYLTDEEIVAESFQSRSEIWGKSDAHNVLLKNCSFETFRGFIRSGLTPPGKKLSTDSNGWWLELPGEMLALYREANPEQKEQFLIASQNHVPESEEMHSAALLSKHEFLRERSAQNLLACGHYSSNLKSVVSTLPEDDLSDHFLAQFRLGKTSEEHARRRLPTTTREFSAQPISGTERISAAYHDGAFYVVGQGKLFRLGDQVRSWTLPEKSADLVAGLERGDLLLLDDWQVLYHFSLSKLKFVKFSPFRVRYKERPIQVESIKPGQLYQWRGVVHLSDPYEKGPQVDFCLQANMKRAKITRVAPVKKAKMLQPMLFTTRDIVGDRVNPDWRVREQRMNWKYYGREGERTSDEKPFRLPPCPENACLTRCSRLGRRVLCLECFPSGLIRIHLWE